MKLTFFYKPSVSHLIIFDFIIVELGEIRLTDHMLMTTLGVQQQMKARTMRTVIRSVLARARLKWVDRVLKHRALFRKKRFWAGTEFAPSENLIIVECLAIRLYNKHASEF